LVNEAGKVKDSKLMGQFQDSHGSSSVTRTVIAGSIGNMLEWYDFGLFGFFAPILAREMMPAEDAVGALLKTFGVFATGFLMRPLGGIMFGFIGDRLGRKRALELSVLLMAISTTLVGLLPTYASIGLAAPLLLTTLRLLQGLSVGGEYIGSMSFLAEHAPARHRAFLASWSSSSVILGSLLSSGTAALLTGSLSEHHLSGWGWRVPFLAGILMGGVGLWLRLGIAESPSFLSLQRAGKLTSNPFKETLRHDLRPLLITLGLTAITSVGFYIPFVWLPTWLSQIIHRPLPEHEALTTTTIALAALLVLTPLTALLSDRVGRRPMVLATALGYLLLSYPLFRLMAHGTFSSALVGGLIFAVSNSFFSGCMAATMVELFPTRTRYSGMALAYNIGQAVLGGTAPLVAISFIEWTNNELAPAFYLTVCAVVAGSTGWFMLGKHGQELD
jgi:MHS family proline/betaine transporter-like MFS transporter